MLENPVPPLWNSSSSMKNSYMESFTHITPSPEHLPKTKKIPLKTSAHFPVTITICKHCSKFVTCSPSNGDYGGASRPQRHSY